MRLRAFEKLMEAIEARKTRAQNFVAPNANWIFSKQRPTQFNSSKNYPEGPREWWGKGKGKSEEHPVGAHNIALEKLKELAGEPTPRA